MKLMLQKIIMKEVDIYWGNRLPVDFLERYPRVRWIHFGSVGIDRFKLIKNEKKIVF